MVNGIVATAPSLRFRDFALESHGPLWQTSTPTFRETLMTGPTTLREILVVSTTVATEAEARRLAQLVLQARLAACVQVEPITAYFRWQGALQEDREFRLACKTVARAVHPLLAMLRSQHPYALPQLVVQTLDASRAYADWVDAEVVSSTVQA